MTALIFSKIILMKEPNDTESSLLKENLYIVLKHDFVMFYTGFLFRGKPQSRGGGFY